jgi:CRP-like cAMP-binding protein
MILETRHSIPEILSRQALFRGLGGMELVKLAQATQEYRLGRNERLFQKGHVARGMHILIAGQIKLFLPAENGSEKVVHMAGPGETFGEECVFLNKPHPVAAEASKDSIVLVVDKTALIAMVDSNVALARAMMARLCMRFCDLVENMETCVQRSSAQRVVHYLTQLNLAPETLSRVLGRLSKAGHIHVRGRSITVKNAKALLGYVAG